METTIIGTRLVINEIFHPSKPSKLPQLLSKGIQSPGLCVHVPNSEKGGPFAAAKASLLALVTLVRALELLGRCGF